MLGTPWDEILASSGILAISGLIIWALVRYEWGDRIINWLSGKGGSP